MRQGGYIVSDISTIMEGLQLERPRTLQLIEELDISIEDVIRKYAAIKNSDTIPYQQRPVHLWVFVDSMVEQIAEAMREDAKAAGPDDGAKCASDIIDAGNRDEIRRQG